MWFQNRRAKHRKQEKQYVKEQQRVHSQQQQHEQAHVIAFHNQTVQQQQQQQQQQQAAAVAATATVQPFATPQAYHQHLAGAVLDPSVYRPQSVNSAIPYTSSAVTASSHTMYPFPYTGFADPLFAAQPQEEKKNDNPTRGKIAKGEKDTSPLVIKKESAQIDNGSMTSTQIGGEENGESESDADDDDGEGTDGDGDEESAEEPCAPKVARWEDKTDGFPMTVVTAPTELKVGPASYVQHYFPATELSTTPAPPASVTAMPTPMMPYHFYGQFAPTQYIPQMTPAAPQSLVAQAGATHPVYMAMVAEAATANKTAAIQFPPAPGEVQSTAHTIPSATTTREQAISTMANQCQQLVGLSISVTFVASNSVGVCQSKLKTVALSRGSTVQL